MKRRNPKSRSGERGIALITVLLAIMLLSAIALGVMYTTNLETSINSNFRTQQVAYFAARAGLEEARARLMKGDPNSLYAFIANGSMPTAAANYDPGMVRGPLTYVPTDNNRAILYILNEGNAPGTVQPWNAGNQYVDDELCHDGYTLTGLQAQNSLDYSVRCTTVPNGNLWYSTVTSTSPWAGTSAALSWKWVRVAMKLNGSQQNYLVNTASGGTSQVCFNAGNEDVMPGGRTQCIDTPTVSDLSMSQVYLVTVLAVTPSGARRMVQAEIAMQPTQPFQFGMFATGTGCGALSLGGGGTTDAYNSALGPYGGANVTTTGGDVGANGNVSTVGGTTSIGGSVGTAMNAGAGSCANGFGFSPTGTPIVGDPGNTPCSAANAPPNCVQSISSPIVLAAPAPPSPAPPTTNYRVNSSQTVVPGTYGDVNVTAGAVLTLQPGTYNLNSLTLAGNATIVVSPPGAVVLNVAGQGFGTNSKVVDLGGGSISDPGAVPGNFLIEYAGTAKLALNGSSTTFATVYAPNAQVAINGGSDWYGAIIGNTVADSGGTHFHYDLNSKIVSSSNGYPTLMAFRESFY